MKSLASKKLQNGKYTLNQELGEGGFGRTYLATDEILDRVVVIKTFKSSPSQENELAQIRKQFLNEAQRLVQCYHLNIVRFYEFFIEDEVPYIVMDYIEGKTLDEIVFPENPLSEATAVKYIRQIGEALKVVHSQGLLHRDIKPQNLILSQANQQVVLIDFGISREFNQNTIQTHTSVVSDGYAPIEQYLPKAQRTPASDIYALAATMYTLLTAQIPIPATLRNRIALDTPKYLRPELSEQVSTAIMLGMALELEERPGNVEEWLNWLPQADNNNSSPLSVKTVTSTKAKTKSVKLPTVPPVKKPRYSHRILQGLIAFATVIWGLDYIWLRFDAASNNNKIPVNSTEIIPLTQPPAISAEESNKVTSQEIQESSASTPIEKVTPKEIQESSASTPIEKVTPKEIQESSASTPIEKVTSQEIQESSLSTPIKKVTSSAPITPVSPPQTVTPKPVKKSSPSPAPITPVSPPSKINPPHRTKSNSDRVPSIFVSPNELKKPTYSTATSTEQFEQITPKTNNSSSSNKIPSIFVSPNQSKGQTKLKNSDFPTQISSDSHPKDKDDDDDD